MEEQTALLDDFKKCEAPHCLGNDELFNIIGPLIRDKMTAKKCRQYVSDYEEKHFFYFSLFKPLFKKVGQSWIENAKQDIKNISKNGVAPSLRELYAISEIISRNVIVLHKCKEGKIKGVQIEPMIRETEDDRSMPLILLLTLEEEIIHVKKSDKKIDHLNKDGFIINAGHARCVDKRFRNNFDDLQNFLFNAEEMNSCATNYPQEAMDTLSGEVTNLFLLIGKLIYGSEENEKDVQCLLKNHMEVPEFRPVYMQHVNVEENVATENKSNQESTLKKRIEEEFKQHLTGWKTAEIVDFFAIASVFNLQVYVVFPNGNQKPNLYLPICGSYLYTFKSPLIFQNRENGQLFKVNIEDLKCPCFQKTPEIVGQFPVYNNDFDIDRVNKLDLKPCCPPERRHGRHQHYQRTLKNDTCLYERDDEQWPGTLDEDAILINEMLAEEGRQLDMIQGGKGTLAQCLGKEIYGNIDAELQISLSPNVEEALVNVAEWTGFALYIFRYSKEHHVWTLEKPATLVNNKQCRYYITLAIIEKNGKKYVDRVSSNSGCNCMLTPPNINCVKVPTELERIDKGNRHRPLLTFFPTKPPEDWFSDDVRREETIIPIYSELRLVLDRSDMADRLIDIVSDYTHSLYRCISKDIFGNENQYQEIMKEVIKEIEENPREYGQLLKAEKEHADTEFLKTFKYRDNQFFDILRSRTKILEKCAKFYTERIEDGMALEDLELIAAATCFQVPIYVLSASVHEDKTETEWKLFTQIRRRKQPHDFLQRRQYLAGENAVFKCLADDEKVSKFHITLFRTFSGQFHRISPVRKVCNCLMKPPVVFLPMTHTHSEDQDFRLFFETNRFKTKLNMAKLALDNWMRCNAAFEILCTEIVDELEGRRRNVNISTIVGSSVGIAGSALAIAGVIAAPFTAGVSLGLTVTGTVIGSLSGASVVGAKITETVLNRDANEKFERYYMNLQEHTRVLIRSLKDLEAEIDNIKKQNTVDVGAIQTAARALCAIGGVPFIVVRIVVRAASFADVVLPPLSAVLDLGVLGYSIYNLVKGSKTNVTEKVRSLRSILRATRTQLSIWAYGNQKKFLQAMDYGK